MVLNLSALVSLIPAALMPLRRARGRDSVFWVVLAAAVVGPVVLALALTLASGRWQTGFGPTLWVSIAAAMIVYVALAALSRSGWRVAPLLLPYLLVLGALATAWNAAPGRPLVAIAPSAWLQVHIAVSVFTYAILTIAAVFGLAVLVQERAVRAKHPTGLSRMLPSVAESEMLQVQLLMASEIVLGVGLLSGMATQYFTTGTVIVFDHKVLFSLATFAVIGALLIAHSRTGTRGRRVARLVLLAYLLLTLGFPGVKFVTDVLVT